MSDALAPLPIASEARDLLEAKLIGMVLDGVTSLHSCRYSLTCRKRAWTTTFIP
jgi:hypothetical protein